MTAVESRPGRRLSAIATMAAVALLFGGPFMLCLYRDTGFLNIANESLAYRFFYPERILAGETLTVGVGYPVSVAHHAVYAAIHLFPVVAGGTLETRLDLFAITTNGVLSLLVCMLLVAAARTRRLTATDLPLLALVSLAPVYGTVYMGFYYHMMVDYHFINIALCIATLLAFQMIWGQVGPVSRTAVLLRGAFAGLAAANKITMVVMTGIVLVPAVMFRRSDCGKWSSARPLRWQASSRQFLPCISFSSSATIRECGLRYASGGLLRGSRSENLHSGITASTPSSSVITTATFLHSAVPYWRLRSQRCR